ncbi:MAG: 16S rRNA (cytosine(1402)-N(4))-methyltransferase RsmH [Bdellovibrionaceae bacterium]|nr:16S rRNA (cytosine(1402)-N(4))-methyltransferase RsmH [Pseudobdellovibrionaceae bacterium]
MSEFVHIPVLLEECKAAIQGMDVPPQLGLDLTFGRGGHARAFLQIAEGLKILAVDQDAQAIQEGKLSFATESEKQRIEFHHCNFHHWPEYAREHSLPLSYDYIMMDLGVSSPQLDTPERGFSFYHDGPLDMRMDQRQTQTAAHVVNEFDEEDLNQIFKVYGEVRSPYRVTREILEFRKQQKFTSTLQLSSLIEKTDGWRKKGVHPATQYFMALRLYLNNELGGLRDVLPQLMAMLNPKGRMLVISFHSLEDRIVKTIFKTSELGKPVNKKVIKPTRDEELQNKRSRSAQLRVFQKGEVL